MDPFPRVRELAPAESPTDADVASARDVLMKEIAMSDPVRRRGASRFRLPKVAFASIAAVAATAAVVAGVVVTGSLLGERSPSLGSPSADPGLDLSQPLLAQLDSGQALKIVMTETSSIQPDVGAAADDSYITVEKRTATYVDRDSTGATKVILEGERVVGRSGPLADRMVADAAAWRTPTESRVTELDPGWLIDAEVVEGLPADPADALAALSSRFLPGSDPSFPNPFVVTWTVLDTGWSMIDSEQRQKVVDLMRGSSQAEFDDREARTIAITSEAGTVVLDASTLLLVRIDDYVSMGVDTPVVDGKRLPGTITIDYQVADSIPDAAPED